MREKLLFIYNAHAGKGQIKNHLVDIIDIFTKKGYVVTVHPTQDRGDATNCVINEADGYGLVVCSGGDGTLDEVVSGMKKRKDLGKTKIPIG